MAYIISNKEYDIKNDRSLTLNSKEAVIEALGVIEEKDDFNASFLFNQDGDGLQDLIKLYYRVFSLEAGTSFSVPTLEDYTESYWENLLSNSLDQEGYIPPNMGVENAIYIPDPSSQLAMSIEDSGLVDNLTDFGEYIENINSFQTTEFIDFVPSDNPSFKEGRVFYDTTKHTLAYYNDINENENYIAVNLGTEFLVRVKNDTGGVLANGTVVYPKIVEGSEEILVGLADAKTKSKSRNVLVTTQIIPLNGFGYATKLGEVIMNTSVFTSGQILYLSSDTPGALTTIKPDDESYLTIIGNVKKVDTSYGVIFVNIINSEFTVESTDVTGFTSEQRDKTEISFDNTTNTFSIGLKPEYASDEYFYYYIHNEKIKNTLTQTVEIEETYYGIHYIYFEGSSLTSAYDLTDDQIINIMKNNCPVAIVYWDSENKEGFYLGDQRYGIDMSSATLSYLYYTEKAKYISGFALSNFTTETFTINSGTIITADLLHSKLTQENGLPIIYLDGDTNWKIGNNSGFSFLTGTNGRILYNIYNSPNWETAEAIQDTYVLYHIVADNGISTTPYCIMGQSVYNSKHDAIVAASNEVTSLLHSKLPIKEVVFLATIVFKQISSESVEIQEVEIGKNFIDWRYTSIFTNSLNELGDIIGENFISLSGDTTNRLVGEENLTISLNLNTLATNILNLEQNLEEGEKGLLGINSDNSVEVLNPENIRTAIGISYAEDSLIEAWNNGEGTLSEDFYAWSPLLLKKAINTFGYRAFTIAEPASIWNIQHNLNRNPSVTITDENENIIYGEVNYVDKNNLQLNFNANITGKIFLN